jgi:hypothetical protein
VSPGPWLVHPPTYIHTVECLQGVLHICNACLQAELARSVWPVLSGGALEAAYCTSPFTTLPCVVLWGVAVVWPRVGCLWAALVQSRGSQLAQELFLLTHFRVLMWKGCMQTVEHVCSLRVTFQQAAAHYPACLPARSFRDLCACGCLQLCCSAAPNYVPCYCLATFMRMLV